MKLIIEVDTDEKNVNGELGNAMLLALNMLSELNENADPNVGIQECYTFSMKHSGTGVLIERREKKTGNAVGRIFVTTDLFDNISWIERAKHSALTGVQTSEYTTIFTNVDGDDAEEDPEDETRH